jgi:type III secretory pathway lipoprotein EscJ
MIRLLTALVCLVMLSGCRTVTLEEDLTQGQSREVIALLIRNGIQATAEKGQGAKGRYVVRVPSDRYQEAVILLSKNNLPREPRLTMDQLVSGGGFLPQSREMENLKIDRAFAAEVEELVSHLPGVRSVRAVVHSHHQSEGERNPEVTITVHQDQDGMVKREELQVLGSRVVPGVPSEKVQVFIHRSDDIRGVGQGGGAPELMDFLGGVQVSKHDHTKLALLFTLCLALVAGAGGIIGFYIGGFRAIRKVAPNTLTGTSLVPIGARVVERIDSEDA